MKIDYLKIFGIIACSFSITGCLKDKAYNNMEIQSSQGSTIKAIGIGLTVSDPSNFSPFYLSPSANDTTINLIPVTLASQQPAPQDLHVTLVATDTLVDNYNNDNGTEYVVPTKYSVVNPGGVVIIPKGSYTGYLQVKFIPNDFIGTDYAVGYTISKIAEPGYVLSNLVTGIAAIGIINKYDGRYTLQEKTTGWGAYGIADGVSYAWPKTVLFATSNSVSNIITTAEEGTFQTAFTPTGGLTGFGATKPLFTFDASNKLTVTNLIPDDGRGRTFKPNPAVTDSRYDPATGTIYAAYIMTQNGRPNQFIYDTLVYVKHR